MGARLHEQFMDFHGAIKIDKESTILKERSDLLKADFKKFFPVEVEKQGIELPDFSTC